MSRRCVAFLRGINVGGRRITGPELVEVAAVAGFSDAASYQASGNLVFDRTLAPGEVEQRLAEALDDLHGWEVEVFARSVDELRSVVADLPFSTDQLTGRGKPQVVFTHHHADVSGVTVDRDLIAAAGRHVYWVPHTSVLDADLAMSDLERATGSCTVRTLGTIDRLVAKFG